jgi:serine/threonine-protein kinase PpkA
MSPEQGHGQPLDERSDLYSLGVIFYEMLTRQKPYVAQSPMGVIYMHANAPIPLLPESLRKYQQLLNKLLAKDPMHRLASASALLAKIEELR